LGRGKSSSDFRKHLGNSRYCSIWVRTMVEIFQRYGSNSIYILDYASCFRSSARGGLSQGSCEIWKNIFEILRYTYGHAFIYTYVLVLVFEATDIIEKKERSYLRQYHRKYFSTPLTLIKIRRGRLSFGRNELLGRANFTWIFLASRAPLKNARV